MADDMHCSLKTQTTYVQHEEHELEKKRLHCKFLLILTLDLPGADADRGIYRTDIKVVNAFKSALALLQQ